MSDHYGTVNSPSKRLKLDNNSSEELIVVGAGPSIVSTPPNMPTAPSSRQNSEPITSASGLAAPPVSQNVVDIQSQSPQAMKRLWDRLWEPPPNPLGGVINNPNGSPTFGDAITNFGTPVREYRPPAFRHPLPASQNFYPLSTPPPPVRNGNENMNLSGNSSGEGKASTLGASVIDLTGDDDDDDDVQIVSNRVVTRDLQIVHPNVSEVCFGLMEKMYVTAHSLPAPIPLDDRFTTHWPRIPVSLKCHGGGSSLCVGVIDPFGKEFGSLDTNSARVLVPLLERKLVRLQTIVLPRKKQPGHLPGPETDGKCKTPLEMQANLYGPVMNLGAVAKVLADKNGRLKRPSQTDGLEYVPPMGAPSVSRVLPVQVDAEAAVFSMLEELQKQVENLPDAEADPRIVTPLLRHQKQGLYFMMNKEKDRDYTDSKGNTSLWRSFGHGSRAMYENVITCDKTHKKPHEVYGGILADVMGLGKTLQVICLIVSSLDAAAAFAAPVEGERPPKRRVKTTLVVSPLSTIGNWEGQIKAHVKFGTLSVYVYHGPKRELSIEKLAQYDVILTTYQIAGGEFAKHTTGGGGASALKKSSWMVGQSLPHTYT
ncbi:hypothetical protein C7212DRAFT_365909 [Tuber magnatum]|uniref:SNF2 N-terminal domain-containing protein n=1 Tax=Tuber magnatum TaxID=42249 RepID=A0A317SIQ2_9PEZI|nr:hypothetical protein C7212DRAFT_365909 [Tuber magnatum]